MKRIIPFLMVLLFVGGFTASAKVTENEILSIVQIINYDVNDEPLSTGSGVVIDGTGRILTNYHVLEDYYAYDDSYMLVCMTLSVTEEPVCMVVVDVVGVWETADLALLEIILVYDPETEEMIEKDEFLMKYDVTFNHVNFDKQIWDDENVELGDELQILGYPGVGGTTITYTRGTVSGFERLLTDDGYYPWLIKTDASINPGNSGGGAFDVNNYFVGIPSIGTYEMGDMAYVISLPVINLFLNEFLGDEYMAQNDFAEVPFELEDVQVSEDGEFWVMFTDVGDKYKYVSAIVYVKELGLVQGYADGTYKPYNEINRAEFVKILVEGKFQEYLQDYKPGNCFKDVAASDWYAKYVCFAKDKGIIGGYPDGTFKPAQNVNVAEALKIVLETYFGNVTPVDGEWYQKYVDYAHKQDFWLDEWMSESYLLKRGEMAELMYRALIMING